MKTGDGNAITGAVEYAGKYVLEQQKKGFWCSNEAGGLTSVAWMVLKSKDPFKPSKLRSESINLNLEQKIAFK
jgi:hypothetical protein